MAEPQVQAKPSWLSILNAVSVLLLGLGTLLFTGSAPTPVPLPKVEQWYVTRAGEVVDAPSVVAVAESLPQGEYLLQGFPKSGKISTVTVGVNRGDVPAPVPPQPIPPKPEPPVPPQPPKPNLTGFALAVFEEANGKIPPATCSALATIYDDTAKKITQGSIVTLTQATNTLKEQRLSIDKSGVTSEFAIWLNAQLSQQADSLPKAALYLSETAKGLRAVK